MNQLLTRLSDLGANLWHWIAWMNLWAAVLLAGAALADRLLARRVSAAWRMALYAVVLARLALPVDWRSPLGLAPSGQREPAATVQTFTLTTGAEPLTKPLPMPATTAHHAATSPTRWTALVPVAYTLGAVALALAVLIRRARLHALLAACVPAGPAVAAMASRMPVFEHPQAGPFLAGTLHPSLVVPVPLLTALDQPALAAILRHESAHVARRDPLLAAALQLLLVACWPVLPLWLAARRVRQLMEQACDERALAGCDEAARRAYGRTLLDVVELLPRLRGLAGAAPLGLISDVHGRLAALEVTRRWHRAIQPLTILALAATLLSCTAAGARTADQPQKSAQAAEPAAPQPAGRPTIGVTVHILSGIPDYPKLDFPPSPSAARGKQTAGSPSRILSASERDEVIAAADRLKAVDLLGTPRLVVLPGQNAAITIGNTDDAGIQTDGFHVDLLADTGGDNFRIQLAFEEFGDAQTARRLDKTWLTIAPGHAAAVPVPASAGSAARLLLITPSWVYQAEDDQAAVGPAFPKVEVHARIIELDAQADVAAALAAAGGEHVQNRAQQRGPARESQTWLIPNDRLRDLFDALRDLPGHDFISSPLLIGWSDQWLEIKTSTRDKARQTPQDNTLSIIGRLRGDIAENKDGGDLTIEAHGTHAGGAWHSERVIAETFGRGATRRIPVVVCPAMDPSDRTRVYILAARALRADDDIPRQTLIIKDETPPAQPAP